MRLLLIMLLVVSCGRGNDGRTGNSGRNGVDGKDGVDGTSCHVESLENGARLFCDDGSQSVVYNGEDGRDGEDGSQGEQGVAGVQGEQGIQGETGATGSQGEQGVQGETGVAGADGQNGANGSDGVNGQDGEQGVAGVAGQNGISSVLAIIDPCGDKPGKYDEILLKTDSGLIAYREQSGKKFLAKLAPGNYTTGDDQACNFRVNADNTITEL